jgi:hypothetical protein
MIAGLEELHPPGSRSIDRVLKPALYAEADIPYFWLPDGILLPEPWEIDIPLDRITPRSW